MINNLIIMTITTAISSCNIYGVSRRSVRLTLVAAFALLLSFPAFTFMSPTIRQQTKHAPFTRNSQKMWLAWHY